MDDPLGQPYLTRRRSLAGAGVAAGAVILGRRLAGRALPFESWREALGAGRRPAAADTAPSVTTVRAADARRLAGLPVRIDCGTQAASGATSRSWPP